MKDPSKRLGSSGASEVQQHPLFKSIDWKRLEAGKMKPLFEPDVSITDFSFQPVFGRPFVKRFALCYGTVVCLSVLSVTLVYCGQTVGWIKMKLGLEVGLGTGHIVLDGDAQLCLPKKGAQQPPPFGPCLLWPNGSMDQDATWNRDRPQCRRHYVRWWTQLPPS